MIKFLVGIFSLGLILRADNVSAAWQNIYQKVKDAYIGNVSVDDLASASLKGLAKVDDNLTVGSGVKTITLYYKGRVIDSVNKPEDENNIEEWGKITDRFVDKAIQKSKVVAENDFMIADKMAAEIPQVLDEDSKFFNSLDEAGGISVRNKRTFAERNENNLLVIKIVAFNKQTVVELKNAIAENENTEALVFDLRGCFGGMSSEAILATDLFLDSGIITSMQGKNKDEEIFYNADEYVVWKNKPIFILVDEKTASASEIFASALKDQGVAKVIGTVTNGKGTMQKLISLETGSVLAVTNSFFKTPANNEIDGIGIKPDVCTFELNDTDNVEDILSRKYDDCHRQAREESELEYKIVQKLLKKDE